jgi:hypothetical protein
MRLFKRGTFASSDDSGSSQHRRSDDLYVKKFACLVGGKLGERHVVRDASVVDEHGEFFACAHVDHRLHTSIATEIGDQRPNDDVWKRRSQFFEPFATTAYDHEIVPVGAEPAGKGATDTGGCASDQGQSGVAVAIPFLFALSFCTRRFLFRHIYLMPSIGSKSLLTPTGPRENCLWSATIP